MKSFNHVNAGSVSDCVSLLRKSRGRATLMAGGTDLLGVLKDRILPDYPETIIDIKEINGLDYIREDNDKVTIGALTKLAAIAESPLIREKYGVLAESAREVATPVIRKAGTIGGNLCQDTRCWYYRYPHSLGGRMLCHRKGVARCPAVGGDNRYHAIMGGEKCFASCPSDTAVALLALDARLGITGPSGTRTVPVGEFYTPMGNVLEPDEILTEIQIPPLPEKTHQAFLKFTLRKPIDFAIASVAAVTTREENICRDARIGLGAVAPVPLRATAAENMLAGSALTTETVRAAAEAGVRDARPLSMNAYKVAIVKTLIRRALLQGES